MPLSFSSGGNKALGFTSAITVLASSAVYSFVSSPFGYSGLPYPHTSWPEGVPVPPVVLETSNNLNASSFVFYVHGSGAGIRPLYWRIKHITTTAADFGEVSGLFNSNNWGISAYPSPGSWYNNPYGEELGRFGVYIVADNSTEGTETFQVEVREASYTGPIVLTSPVISIADTSAPATFSFDTAWNDAISQGGLTEGNTYEFRVNGINLSTGEEYPVLAPYPEGWRTYYTIDGMPINYNYPNSQYYTYAINKDEGTQWAQVLPAMHIYVKNAEYFDNVLRPGYGSPTNTTRKHTYGSGKFYIAPRNDGVTEGPTTHTIQLRTSFMNPDYTGGAIIATYTFTINDPYNPAGRKAIFGYGYTNTDVSMTNLVSNTGVVASDTTGVGSSRSSLAAAGYGTDKAIFGYGYTAFGSTYYSMTNLVTNTGAVGNDVTGVGSARYGLAAAGYGTDKAIFGYGYTGYGGITNFTNLVSNTGVVANAVANSGNARYELAAASYGTDKAIFGYGVSASGYTEITNLVSNIGIVSIETSSIGTPRAGLAAAGYGTDKAIFGYGNDGSYLSITNLVSNTGVVSTDSTGVYSTARRRLAASVYGADKAIFGYGYNGGSQQSVTNLVSNTGVIASDTTGVGTARMYLAAASYG